MLKQPMRVRRYVGNTAVRRLEADGAGECGGNAQGSPAVRADVDRRQRGRRCDRGTPARAARCQRGVVGIWCRTEQQVVGRAFPSECRCVRLAYDDRTGSLEGGDHAGIFRGYMISKQRRTGSRDNTLGHDVVFDRKWYAEQERRVVVVYPLFRQQSISACTLDGSGDEGIQNGIKLFDPPAESIHDFDRRGLAGPEELPNARGVGLAKLVI